VFLEHLLFIYDLSVTTCQCDDLMVVLFLGPFQKDWVLENPRYHHRYAFRFLSTFLTYMPFSRNFHGLCTVMANKGASPFPFLPPAMKNPCPTPRQRLLLHNFIALHDCHCQVRLSKMCLSPSELKESFFALL
jgi:hypothetical protein